MIRPKLVLVGFRLSGGGSGRVLSNLSTYFVSQGFDVHIIIFHDQLGYEYHGQLFNLGKYKSDSNNLLNKIKRFILFRDYFKKHEFDFIIDFRFRKRIIQELLISRCVYKIKNTIYTIHSSKLDEYLPKSAFWTKIIYGSCYKIVAISNEMEELVNKIYPNLSNIDVIYNPINTMIIDQQVQEKNDFEFEYIICAGRYDTNIKQFDKLIEAYANSNLPHSKIHLVIMGAGVLLGHFKLIAKQYDVTGFVHFTGFKSNPYKYYKRALFFVLCSKYEGMPMVLIESLASGTPVISFDCPTGPKEIISHKENGLLVKNSNFQELVLSMNLMLNDIELYKKCRDNSKLDIGKFDLNNVGKQWMQLMQLEVLE